MEKLEEIDELRLDFTKLEKVGGQVTATRASGTSPCDPGVIHVAVQNADTKEVISDQERITVAPEEALTLTAVFEKA